jgi:hypothetical protein
MSNVIAVVDALVAPDPSPVPLRGMWWQRSVSKVAHWIDRLTAADRQCVAGASAALRELRAQPRNLAAMALNAPVPLWCLDQDDPHVLVAGAALAACDARLQACGRIEEAIANLCVPLGSPLVLAGAGCLLDPASRSAAPCSPVELAEFGSRTLALVTKDPILAGATIDPFAKLEAGDEIEAFGRPWQEALALLRMRSPGFSRAMEACLACVIPMRVPERGFPSASTNSVPGAACITATHDVALIAEQLTHEVSHAHLFALQESDPLLAPESHGDGWGDPLVYSPWRDDARPLNGLLHGAVVFSRVAWLHAGLADRLHTSRRRLAAIGPQVRAALSGLAQHATMTAAGERLMLGLAESERMLGSIREEWNGTSEDPMYVECSSIVQDCGTAHGRQQSHHARCASGVVR